MIKLKLYLSYLLIGGAMFAFFGCTSFKTYTPPVRTNTNSALQAKLQIILDESINKFKLPGIQAGIRLSDGTTIVAASGTNDFAHKQKPIDNHGAFRVGSTTKMFTAALICRLAEQGKLALNDPIEHWFPGKTWAKTITIHDLLQQTSGIPETLFTNPGILVQSVLNNSIRWVPAEVAETVMNNVKLPPPVERKFVYSNNNYVLLGLIAEKCGGRPLSDQLQTEFFTPLGMTDTWLLPFRTPAPDHLVPGYDEYIPFGPHELDGIVTAWDSLTWAAGAMASSAPDLLQWLDALFHDRVLKPESLAAMKTWVDARNNGRDNDITAYGLGIAHYELDGRQLLGHPGGGFGGECFPFYWPDRDISIVVSYNLSRKDNPAGKVVLNEILRLLE